MATSNATADDVRVALKPLETTLSDAEINKRIEGQTQLVNQIIDKDYTTANEPLNVKWSIIHHTVFDIVTTIFFDENLDKIRWRWNDVEIEHGQNAFAIRDFAFNHLQHGRMMLMREGVGTKSATHYTEWETKGAGRYEDYYYGKDRTVVDS